MKIGCLLEDALISFGWWWRDKRRQLAVGVMKRNANDSNEVANEKAGIF